MSAQSVRIGCGAGFATDRIDAAVEVVEQGNVDWLVLECLAERTIAFGHRRERAAPGTGYEPTIERRMRALLGPLVATGTRLISNFGAANPMAAGELVRSIANEMGIKIKVAVVTGDDVMAALDMGSIVWETGRPLGEHESLISANAYLGIDALLPAIATGADVIISGRVADPSLFLAPAVAELGWSVEDYQLLAAGTVAGHLLECGGQVTGGYFADPPYKVVPDIARVGFPIAEITADGAVVVTKVPGTGGVVNFETVCEQLTYEVIDPTGYLTPDVILDLTEVRLTEVGRDRVEVHSATGRPRPNQLKVSVGQAIGYLAEGEMSYAGPGCVTRAEISADILRKRLSPDLRNVRIDIVGVNSLNESRFGDSYHEPAECRIRMAAIAENYHAAELANEEVITLYTNGPAGGGGCRTHIYDQIGILSVLMDRDIISTDVHILETA